MPSTIENSCNTPSILTEVTAPPCKEDNKTLLKALPKVKPKPLSKGSTTIFAIFLPSPELTSKLVGLISSCQFF